MRGWIIAGLAGLGLAALGVALVGRPGPSATLPADPVAAAWAEVTARPQDPAAWTRLGEVQVEADALPAAAHAFRTALALGDDSGLAYARLGFLLYGQGEDAQARALLVEARRRGASAPMLDETIAALEEAPEAPHPQPPAPAVPVPPLARRPDGGAAVRLDASTPMIEEAPPDAAADCAVPLRRRGQGVFLVDVRVDGVPGTLVLDTGASITVLTEDFAARVGLRADPAASIEAVTANGRVRMPTAEVGALELGAFSTAGVRAAICATCMEGLADGLLGLDVQARFQIELDLSRGAARFGDCE